MADDKVRALQHVACSCYCIAASPAICASQSAGVAANRYYIGVSVVVVRILERDYLASQRRLELTDGRSGAAARAREPAADVHHS